MSTSDINHETKALWISTFEKLFSRKSKSLRLLLNAQSSSGEVEVFSPSGKRFTQNQKKWIIELKEHVAKFPEIPEFWLLANIDGWHIGQGSPAFYSTTSVGVGGAQGSLRDDFHEHYLHTFDIEYTDVDEDLYLECDCDTIQGGAGDFKTKNICY